MVAIGALAYVVQLIATIPASVVVPQSPAIVATSGTLWRGRATLADGNLLEWHWAPLRSAVSLGFAADWRVDGLATTLAGRALLRRHSMVIDEASGSAAGSLLGLAMPMLPFVCTMPLQIVLDRAAIGGSDQVLAGEIRADAGSCSPRAGGVATVTPPLVASFGRLGKASEISVAPMAMRREILVHGLLDRDGRLGLRVTPAGGRALPFLAPPMGLSIDTIL